MDKLLNEKHNESPGRGLEKKRKDYWKVDTVSAVGNKVSTAEKKRVKALISIAVALFFMFLMMGIVEAGCVTPVEGMTITEDTVLCSGTYQINDSGLNGVISFGADNVTLICDDTVLVGNDSGTAIYDDGYSGIAIQGCHIEDYRYGLWLRNSQDLKVKNNILGDQDFIGIFLFNLGGSLLEDNYFNQSGGTYGIRLYGESDNNILRDNVFNKSQDIHVSGNTGNEVNDTLFEGNTFIDPVDEPLYLYGYYGGINITRNKFQSGTQYPIRLGTSGGYGNTKIWLNSFMTNNKVYDFTGTSETSYSVDDMGNYWQAVSCTDNDGDYFCDSAQNIDYYTSDGTSQDAHAYKGPWDMDCLIPYEDMVITEDETVCRGTFYYDDSGMPGIMQFGASDITLDCNKSMFEGDNTGIGLFESPSDVNVTRCEFRNYSNAGYVGGLWNRTLVWNSTSSDYAYGIDVDSSGNAYVAGYWRNGSHDDWGMAKYDFFGNQLWNRSLDWASGNDAANDVAVGSSGNAYFVGDGVDGTGLDWGLAKYDPSGNQLWFETLTWSSTTDQALGVDTDDSDNAYVAGSCDTGYLSWCLAKYDSSGNQLWNRTIIWNSTANDQANDVAVDFSGNAYIVGSCDNNGQDDWCVAKYDSSGDQEWNRTLAWNDTWLGSPFGVSVDLSGNVYIGGYWRNGDNYDWGLVKFDPAGNQLWNRSLTWSTSSDYARSVVADDFGNVYLGGYWYNGVDYSYDWALAKYDSSGNQLWNLSLTWSSSLDQIRDIAVDSSGTVYAAGYRVNGAQRDWGLAKISPEGDILTQGSRLFNTTLKYSRTGLNLTSRADNNIFYYNNFSNNSKYQAYAEASGNHFNTTTGGVAHGNWWSDVFTNLLAIYDNSSDGYGDSGPDYPYSQANGGNVSANLIDYGPIALYTCTDNDGDGFYSTSSDAGCPGFRDCDDNNASVFPPYEGMNITTNVTLCSGTYEIADSDDNGLFDNLGDGSHRVILSCNGTALVGDNSGYFASKNVKDHVTIQHCTLANYSQFVKHSNNAHFTYYNNTFANSSSSEYPFHPQNHTYLNITGNQFLSNTHAVRIHGCNHSIIDNNYFDTYGSNELVMYIGENNTVKNNEILCGAITTDGLWILGSPQSQYAGRDLVVENNKIWTCNLRGISQSGYYENVTVNNNNISNMSRGISLYENVKEWKFTQNIIANTSYGIYIQSNCNDSIFTNNTLKSNSLGVYIKGPGSVSNLFYYNNFSNNLEYQVYAEASGNHFNTTDGGVAKGNWWSDIQANYLDIFDSDGDDYGDMGDDYPYNSTNGGNVSLNVQDFGPQPVKGDCNDNDGDGAYGPSSHPNCPGFVDCDDNNSSLFPPIVGKNLTTDSVICSGTYELNSSLGGMMNISNGVDVEVRCNDTVIRGNGSGVFFNVEPGGTGFFRDCTLQNFTYALMFGSLTPDVGTAKVYNMTFLNNTYGVGGISFTIDSTGWINNSNFSGNDVAILEFGCNNTIEGNNIEYSNTYGLDMASYSANIVRNNTFYKNYVAVNLQSQVTNNTFYYNNFTSSKRMHVNASDAGNQFNTTGVSGPEGNWWSDILANNLDIEDYNQDTWGDRGDNYPYNSTNGGNVSANITDWGPQPVTDPCVDVDGDGFNASGIGPDSECGSVRDCDDGNASVFPPHDGMTVITNVTLCSGTYYVNDSGDNGLFSQFGDGTHRVMLSCNGTKIIGNNSGYFADLNVNSYVTLQHCVLANYSEFVTSLVSGDYMVYLNVTFANASGTHSFEPRFSDYLNLSSCKFLHNSGPAILTSCDDAILEGSYFSTTGFYELSVSSDRVLVQNNLFDCEGASTRGVLASGSAVPSGAYQNLTIRENNVTGCAVGIYGIRYFHNVSLEKNNLISNGLGLQLMENNDAWNITKNLIEDSTNDAIRIDDSCDDSVFTNNTIRDNNRGLYLMGPSSSGNLFYYNNFSGNTEVNAEVAIAGNHFNTTIGGEARGNYWDDIQANNLQIIDEDLDGWGEGGTDYPYNETNGGNVDGYVNDWGPRILENPACIEPYDGLTLIFNATLCAGTYEVDTSSSEAIKLDADNLELICNGTKMIGNGTGKLFRTDNSHVSVDGCVIQNYTSGFTVTAPGLLTNISVINCTFLNMTTGVGTDVGPLASIEDFVVRDSNFSTLEYGIGLSDTSGEIKDNNIEHCSKIGIYLFENSIGSDDNNITRNTIDCDLGINITSNSDSNNLWLNHMYQGGVNDLAGTNNNYCMNGDGNFYEHNIPYSQIGHNDCGLVDVTTPDGGDRYGTIVPIQWTEQSTKYVTPVLYYLFYSNNSGTDWYYIDETSSLSYDWDVSNDTDYPDGINYKVRIIPYDSTANGTYNMSESDFEINHTLPVSYDNSTPDERFWYVNTSTDIRIWTETPNWNTTNYCNYSIYENPCTDFASVEDNDTTVTVDGFSNSVYQQYVRYYHNDSDGLSEYPHDSNQINIVYGSYIENTSIWNTTVENNSHIIHSDINDSTINGCYVKNSIIRNSTLTIDPNARNPCRIINSTIDDTTIVSSRVYNSVIDPTTIIDSIVINCTCTDCYIEYSELANTDFCAAFQMWGAIVTETILSGGRISYLGEDYYPVVSTDSICTGLPDVLITYPPAGAVVNGTFTIQYTSTENRSIEISIDGGTWTSTGSNTTYTWDTTNLQDGTHTIQLRDMDPAGQWKYSNLVTVTVDNTPDAITILEPSTGDVLFGNQTVEAIAADYISKVEFTMQNSTGGYALDGTAGSTEDTESTDGWTGSIQTSQFGEGIYNLTATAYTRCYFIADCYNATTTVENLYLDHTPPTGNITIVGSEGLLNTTVYPTVMLNLSYEDNVEVDKCRYANNNTAELYSAPWEECTTVKSWILREGDGMKTVWYEIKDKAGNNQTYKDTIELRYAPDSTPPTQPTVYDGLSDGLSAQEDKDWTDSDTTLSANWFGSTEDLSSIIYYKYRILENGSCYDGDCDYTNVSTETSFTNNSLTLLEGTNYSVEVIAFNPWGVEADPVVSDGVIVDFKEPGTPNITSPTHPDQEESYAESTAIFYFNATDINRSGVKSGIYGYSWSLDDWPGSAPDDIVDGRTYQTITQLKNDGYEQVLKINDTGHAYKVQTEVEGDLEENQTLRIKVALAEKTEDTRDNMDVYIAVADNQCTDFDTCGSMIAETQTTSDIKYAYTMENAKVYEYTLQVNSSVTDGSYYIVVGGDEGDDDNAWNLSIAGTDAPGDVDDSTTTYVCEETIGSCEENASIEYAIGVELLDTLNDTYTQQYDYLGDGTYYFHVKARDNAGNWGNTSHYKIEVDTGGVSLAISEPVDGQLFLAAGDDQNISVKVYTSDNASVYVVAEHPDGSNHTSTEKDVEASKVFGNVTIEKGTNEIYAIANSSNGVKTRSRSVYVILSEEPRPATNKTLRLRYDQCSNTDSNICYSGNLGGVVAGLGGEEGSAAANEYQAETEYEGIKIFATDPGFSSAEASDVNTELEENTFLDRVQPFFGLERKVGEFVIRNELRYQDLKLGGDFRLSPGKYNVYLRHNGVTEDGKVNVTLVVRR